MRGLLSIGLLGLAGCGFVDAVSTPYGEERPRTGVLQTAPNEVSSAPPPPRRCNPDSAFTRKDDFYVHVGAPVFAVRLLPDESVAYGTTVIDGAWALARIEPGKPPITDGIGVSRSGGYPSITNDGSTLYFARYEGVVDGRRRGDVWVSRRDGEAGPFVKAANLPPISTEDEESTPYVIPDGTALYFTREIGSDYAIMRTTLPATAEGETTAFSAGSAPPGDNVNPVVTPDELTLFFGARGARGDLDIWVAKRKDKSTAFRVAAPVVELRTEGDDVPSWISPDGCVLYYERWASASSTRVMRAYREPVAP